MRIRTVPIAIAVLALFMTGTASVSAASSNTTGFVTPFTGPSKFLGLAATQATSAASVNAPIGQQRANRLAKSLGFAKSKALSAAQYTAFVSGQGVGGGTPAATTAGQVISTCLTYQTDTNVNAKAKSADGTTSYPHLGSYGLAVNEAGLLESVANSTNPCRQVNVILEPTFACPPPAGSNPLGLPCGYMSSWMKANGASDTLAALYGSAYTAEVGSASKSQQASGVAQLVTNTKSGGAKSIVGMPMAPSVWLANFLLIYALNPALAAEMPGYWAPVPDAVASAISASSTGQVPFANFASYFAG